MQKTMDQDIVKTYVVNLTVSDGNSSGVNVEKTVD